MKKSQLLLSAGLALLVLLTGCERPPTDTVQHGFRGTGMVQVYNPRILETKQENNAVPPSLPAASADGPKASQVFQNVKVLGDLSVGEFTRLMVSMTAWVAPDQGCTYCHKAGEDNATRKGDAETHGCDTHMSGTMGPDLNAAGSPPATQSAPSVTLRVPPSPLRGTGPQNARFAVLPRAKRWGRWPAGPEGAGRKAAGSDPHTTVIAPRSHHCSAISRSNRRVWHCS